MKMHQPLFMLIAGILLGAGSAAAQPPASFPISDRVSVGFSLGRSAVDGEVSASRGLDLAFKGELPVSVRNHVRFEVAQSEYSRRSHESTLSPPSFGLTRASFSVVRMINPPRHGTPLSFYVGGGLGLYRYGRGFASDDRFVRGGMHVLAGYEAILPGETRAIAFEVQLHGFGGPTEYRSIATMAKISLGYSWRF